MKYNYDSKSDILLIKLSKEKPDFGEQRENIITHYNRKGKPVEIEILDAKKTILKMRKVVSRKQAQFSKA